VLFMALAMSAGNFLYGPLDMLLRTRKWVAVAGNLIMLAGLVFLAFYPAPGVFASTLALMVIGVAGASYGLLMAHGRAFMPPYLTGRGITLLNFFSIGATGLMQFATGAVVATSTVADDPAAAYSALFWFYAIMLAISVFIYLWARDARPERKA